MDMDNTGQKPITPYEHIFVVGSELFLRGGITGTEYADSINNYINFLHKTIKDLEAEEESEKYTEEIEHIKQGYLNQIFGLKQTLMIIHSRDEKIIEKGSKIFLEAAQKIAYWYHIIFTRKMLEEPTHFPFVNQLINTIRLVKNGYGIDEMIVNAMNDFEKQINQMRESATPLFAEKENNESAKQFSDNFERLSLFFDTIFKNLHDYLSGGLKEVLEITAHDLIKGAADLEKIVELLDLAIMEDQQIPCVYCQKKVVRGTTKCPYCMKTLFTEEFDQTSSISLKEESGRAVITSPANYIYPEVSKLYNLANQYKNDQSPNIEFSNYVDELIGKITANLNRQKEEIRQVLSSNYPNDHKEKLIASREEMITALDEFTSGLLIMKDFCDTKSPQSLSDATEIINQAQEKMLRVEGYSK